MKQFVLGGIRSGKSRFAERLASESNREVIYIATAQAYDLEMSNRIREHQRDRPKHWTTIEEEIYLADVLQNNTSLNVCILVDCLTLWLTNLLIKKDPVLLKTEIKKLLETVSRFENDIIFVSTETGLGVVPLGELSRHFCDEAGLLHQKIANICDRVILSVAGLPLTLKGEKYEA